MEVVVVLLVLLFVGLVLVAALVVPLAIRALAKDEKKAAAAQGSATKSPPAR